MSPTVHHRAAGLREIKSGIPNEFRERDWLQRESNDGGETGPLQAKRGEAWVAGGMGVGKRDMCLVKN